MWADPDLIEIEVVARFQEWAGATRAYVTRGELREFATALDAVADGSTWAQLLGGQRDLGYAEMEIREYARARRLAMDLVIGKASDDESGPRPSEVRMSVPLERGGLSAWASGLRRIAETERGDVTVVFPQSWP